MRGSLIAKGVEQLPPVEVRLRRTMDENIEGAAGGFSHLRCSILSKLHSQDTQRAARTGQTYLQRLSVHDIRLQDVHVLGRRVLGELGEVHGPLDVTRGAEYFVLWVLCLQ